MHRGHEDERGLPRDFGAWVEEQVNRARRPIDEGVVEYDSGHEDQGARTVEYNVRLELHIHRHRNDPVSTEGRLRVVSDERHERVRIPSRDLIADG